MQDVLKNVPIELKLKQQVTKTVKPLVTNVWKIVIKIADKKNKLQHNQIVNYFYNAIQTKFKTNTW